MIKRLSPIILDAVIVIEAHERKLWDYLCSNYKIALPAIIFEEELFYFTSDNGKKGLMPSKWLKEGKIERLEAEINHYKYLKEKLSKDFLDALDAGELEALALLSDSKYKNYFFSTADKAAIKALGVLGWRENGISLEELLRGGSVPAWKYQKLQYHFTKKCFEECLNEGFVEKHLWYL